MLVSKSKIILLSNNTEVPYVKICTHMRYEFSYIISNVTFSREYQRE